MAAIGNSIAFRLRGTKSNRDAIDAAITIDHQTKYLRAGSGFLSQHSKEILFGVGDAQEAGECDRSLAQRADADFKNVPINHRIEIEEGVATFSAKAFANPPVSYAQAGEPQKSETLPSTVEAWLIDPLAAPDFSLPDQDRNLRTLQSFRGQPLLLTFCSKTSTDKLRSLKSAHSAGVKVLAVNVDDVTKKLSFPFPIVQATPEIVGVYNIIYRYLFDRRRDLGIPTSFLIDPQGMIVKVYQGPINPKQLAEDVSQFRELQRSAPPKPCPSLEPFTRAPSSATSLPTASPCFSVDTSIRRPHPFNKSSPPTGRSRGLLQLGHSRTP